MLTDIHSFVFLLILKFHRLTLYQGLKNITTTLYTTLKSSIICYSLNYDTDQTFHPFIFHCSTNGYTMKMHQTPPPLSPEWYSLGYCLRFMFRKKRLFGWSFLLFIATIALTTAGYQLSTDYVDSFAGSFLVQSPATGTIWGWIKYQGWSLGKWLFLIITRIVAFYLAFLVAYCITSPGYALLSTAAEKLHTTGGDFEDDSFSILSVFIDIYEGIKIALFGVGITFVALIVNFIPGLGQGAVFLLYAFYSALMFIDYPSSRRRWSLGRKISWIREHSGSALRMGLLPAFVSMIPVLNVFLMSLLFPLLTIHSTLNFSSIEIHRRQPVPKKSS